MSNRIEINSQRPPEGEIIETCKIFNGKEEMKQDLILQGSLFWLKDKSIYIYYTPTHWRPKQ